MSDELLGKIIEEDDYQNPIFDFDMTFSHPLSQKLYDTIKTHSLCSLTQVFETTKDRDLLAYAMELANNYAFEKLNKPKEDL